MVVVLTFAADEGLAATLALVLAVLGEVLSILFVLRVLARGGSAAATWNWILLILLAPYLGLLIYYLLPRRLQRRRLRRRGAARAKQDPMLADLAAASPDLPGAEPLARLVCSLDGDALHEGNRLTLLGSGGEFIAAARAAIESARRFVHLQTYIFRADEAGRAVLEVLRQAAARGVEVRLLYDSVGSWWLKATDLAAFHAAGGRSAPFMPMLWRRRPLTLNLRNHRKLLIVDGEVAFVGGRNVGDEYVRDRFGREHRWLDAMVAIEGPAIARLHRVFVEDWFTATDEDLAAPTYFPPPARRGDQRLLVVESGPDDDAGNAVHLAFFQMIGAAREELRITTPYLVPDPTILTALKVAAGRGVRVRIHTNGREAEAFVLYAAKQAYYPELLDAGVEIIETVGDFTHTKMIVVDEEQMFIGTPNLDMRSYELNFELGVVAFGPEAARPAAAQFDERCEHGRRLRRGDLDCGLARALVRGVCRLLAPVL